MRDRYDVVSELLRQDRLLGWQVVRPVPGDTSGEVKIEDVHRKRLTVPITQADVESVRPGAAEANPYSDSEILILTGETERQQIYPADALGQILNPAKRGNQPARIFPKTIVPKLGRPAVLSLRVFPSVEDHPVLVLLSRGQAHPCIAPRLNPLQIVHIV